MSSKFFQHLNGGNWFVFYRPLVRVTACKLDALFLQDLINIASMPGTVHKIIDGKSHFLCTTEFLERSGIGWTVKEQATRFAALREAGLIQTVKVGIPPRRWVHIDEKRIEASIDGETGENSDAYRSCPNGHDRSCPNGNERCRPNGHEHIEEVRKEKGRKREAALPPVSPAPAPFGPRNGHANGNGFHKPKSPAPEAELKQARKELKGGLQRLGVRWVDNETVQSGCDHLGEVRKRDPNYLTVIKSFVASYRQREQLQLPIISSCNQFAVHYDWLKGNLKKAGVAVKEEMVNTWVDCGNGNRKMVKVPISQCKEE